MGRSLFEAAGLTEKKVTPIFEKGGKILNTVADERNRLKAPSNKNGEEKADGTMDQMMKNGATFIGNMFRLRDTAHLLHLKSESYAEHIALNEFYDALLGYTDTLTEMMQCCGLLDIRIPASVVDHSALEYVSTFKKDIQEFRGQCERADIKAVLDEIEGLCSTTAYKLKFLK